MIKAAGLFSYSAAAIGAAGMLAVFILYINRRSNGTNQQPLDMFHLSKWLLLVSLFHAVCALIYFYGRTDLNFAAAGFHTVLSALSVLFISMACALPAVGAAIMIEAARTRRH